MDLTLDRILHRYPGKRVIAAGAFDGRPAVVKFYRGWRQWPEYRRSLRGARAVMRSGVPAAVLYHAGRAGAQARAALAAVSRDEASAPEPVWYAVFEAVTGDADVAWPPSVDPLDEAAHRRLILTLARHHAAGLIQNDLNWLNFIPREGELVAIDTDRMRQTPAARWLGRGLGLAAGERHLCRLYASKSRIPEVAVADGFQRYRAERGCAADDGEARAFVIRVRAARQRHALAVARRALQGWKHYPRRRHGGGWLHFDRRVLPEPNARALRDAAAASRWANGVRQAFSLPDGGCPVHRAALDTPWQGIRVWCFAAGTGRDAGRGWSAWRARRRAAARARAGWVALLTARRLGVAVERPLLLDTGSAEGARLMTQARDAPTLGECLPRLSHAGQDACLEALGAFVDRLDALGIGHARWHADALAWTGEAVQLRDPVGLWVSRPPGGWVRWRPALPSTPEREVLIADLAGRMTLPPEAIRARLLPSTRA